MYKIRTYHHCKNILSAGSIHTPGFKTPWRLYGADRCRKGKQQELTANCYRKRFNGNI